MLLLHSQSTPQKTALNCCQLPATASLLYSNAIGAAGTAGGRHCGSLLFTASWLA